MDQSDESWPFRSGLIAAVEVIWLFNGEVVWQQATSFYDDNQLKEKAESRTTRQPILIFDEKGNHYDMLPSKEIYKLPIWIFSTSKQAGQMQNLSH
ncbi:hypothetical protein [Spirosoma pollinicola]|uniref:hypothetical protein n=1 Tax=Spirosoma pollinicola TaxID=2057025 RepID=UPI0012FD70D0|nr:hypothetical protein [Spirosoma pollinicola]